MASDEIIRAQALDWAVRTNDPGFTDWEGFTLWLEAAPIHAEAYDMVCVGVMEGAELVGEASRAIGTSAPNNRTASKFIVSRRWIGGAMAASLVFLLGIGAWQRERADLYIVATEPGEVRTISLAGGTSITLAGSSRIELDHRHLRFARLEQGKALFTVQHDPSSPFRVVVGENELVDIGTVFDVHHEEERLSVAVSEGAVQFNPDAEDVRIAPGQVLTKEASSDRYVLSSIPLQRVGEWREGRLTFEGASLEQVARDLTRATGIVFSVGSTSGSTADTPTVSGSVLIEPIRKDPQALGGLLGLEVSSSQQGWIIRPYR